jgi:hypothetical protein
MKTGLNFKRRSLILASVLILASGCLKQTGTGAEAPLGSGTAEELKFSSDDMRALATVQSTCAGDPNLAIMTDTALPLAQRTSALTAMQTSGSASCSAAIVASLGVFEVYVLEAFKDIAYQPFSIVSAAYASSPGSQSSGALSNTHAASILGPVVARVCQRLNYSSSVAQKIVDHLLKILG